MKTKLQEFLKTVLERGLSIATYIFPFLEITVYFSSRVCYSSNDIGLKVIYANYLYPLMLFYEKNVYLIFIAMVAIFLMCSKIEQIKVVLVLYNKLGVYFRHTQIESFFLSIFCQKY